MPQPLHLNLQLLFPEDARQPKDRYPLFHLLRSRLHPTSSKHPRKNFDPLCQRHLKGSSRNPSLFNLARIHRNRSLQPPHILPAKHRPEPRVCMSTKRPWQTQNRAHLLLVLSSLRHVHQHTDRPRLQNRAQQLRVHPFHQLLLLRPREVKSTGQHKTMGKIQPCKGLNNYVT